MPLLDDLKRITDICELESYIILNSISISDFFNQSHCELIRLRSELCNYVLLNPCFRELKANKETNVIFLIYLFGYFERHFPRLDCCQVVFTKLRESEIEIGNRLEAASLFLFVRSNHDYITRYEEIISKLQLAYCHEEDQQENVLITFSSYFLNVLTNPPPKNNPFIIQLREKIIESIANEGYGFLNHNLIGSILLLDVNNVEVTRISIQNLIDALISASVGRFAFIEDIGNVIIEAETDYVSKLNRVEASFEKIRNISVEESENILDPESVYYSLARGVAVITNEDQMRIYMKSYGNMHRSKLISAIKFINQEFIDGSLEIIDWACGQGVASMVLMEELQNCFHNLYKVILIEPSLVCLARAALHIKKYKPNVNLKTIRKDFNSLRSEDIKTSNQSIKIHLFSNILDVSHFTLRGLIELISKSLKGVNYFVCVSPYIDLSKTQRIKDFVSYFQRQFPTSFTILANEINSMEDRYWSCNHLYRFGRVPCNASKHGVKGCASKWTRVAIVFKITI